MNLKQTFGKAVHTLKKHSPAILTGAGVVGLGATAYLAYKSKDKVEAVVEEIERKNDLEIPVSKAEVAKDITEAIYQPVVVGAASVACIIFAHRIQHKRIVTLAGALAVEQARNAYFESKYKKQHGEEAYNKFMTPTEEVEHIEVDKNGKEKRTVEEVQSELNDTIGQWYDQSTEYVSDDHSYNMAYIESVEDQLQTILFQRGSLQLNEVREKLGFDRIRSGALLGWTSADSFEIIKRVSNMPNKETGELEPQIYVTWTNARYIYNDVDFNGRYSVYA